MEIGVEYKVGAINDTNPILPLLSQAKYPEAWRHHYHMGVCYPCPECRQTALVIATICDEKHDEMYEVGEGCDFCDYRKDY